MSYHCLVFTKAAIQHLRLRFSLLLMPAFWLSIWGLQHVSSLHTSSVFHFNLNVALGFIVWHIFIYPASNAYNSYQDQDKGSIGDIKSPLHADQSVFYTSVFFNLTGLVMAFFVSKTFCLFTLVYVISSQLYSWRKVRLKQYPILGFLTVFIFQGFWVLLANKSLALGHNVDMTHYLILGLAASFMFGGGYPITQIYQHKQDRADGVKTISMLLGINGTLIFSGVMNAIGLILLAYVVIPLEGVSTMMLYLLILSPSFYAFAKWSAQVQKDESMANFENVMQMTWISAICNNIAILMLILKPQVINWLL